MKTALIVSSFFPPFHSAGGSIRLVKLIKHLSGWGWNFVVYTRGQPGSAATGGTLSGFLLEELPQGIEIRRIADPFTGPHGGAILWPPKGPRDSSLGWGLNVVWHGIADPRTREADLIFGVTPPFSNALAATLLAKLCRKPLVLDMKDDWVGSPDFLRKSTLRQKIEARLERWIIQSSAAVITVTPQSFQLYRDRYSPWPGEEKFYLIPNGCDLEEYERLSSRVRRITSERFLILSAAWGFRKDYRDITPFFLALSLLLKRRPEARGRIDVVLLGESLSEDYKVLMEQLDLAHVIKSVGAVQREELVEWLWKADLFLLVQPVHNTTAVSGTLYEYWATGKAPVLLISEEGASSALVTGHHLGGHFRFDQITQIADYIERIYDAYTAGQPEWIERAGVQNFDRRILAKRMDELWQKVLAAP